MRKCYNWLFVSGAGVLIVAGVLIFHYAILPFLIHRQVGKTLALNNNTDAWDRFVTLPVPLYFRVYVFNLVNPDDVFRGEKPIVKEVGPFVYKETREKFNLHLFDENDTVRYEERSIFQFDAELSHPLTEEDYVQPGNPTAPIVNAIVERLPEVSFLDQLLDPGFESMFGDRYKLVLNVTAKELLFDGIFSTCRSNGSFINKIVCSAIYHFPLVNVCEKHPNGDLSIAILRFKNDTSRGVFEVDRGNDNIDNIGRIYSINGKSTMTNWPGQMCNDVKNSYAESLVKPFLTLDSRFNFYDDDACTSSPMVADSATTSLGIDCLKFVPAPSFLGSVTDYPENNCYCPASIGGVTWGAACLKTGIMDISPCQGVPALLSFPHFLGAHSQYQHGVDGLNPDPDLHQTYINLEPITGTPVTGAKRIQINFELKGTPSLKITGSARDVLLPFLWIEESVELQEAQLSMLKDQLLKVLNIANIIKWVLIGVGSLMALIGGIMAYVSYKREHPHPD